MNRNPDIVYCEPLGLIYKSTNGTHDSTRFIPAAPPPVAFPETSFGDQSSHVNSSWRDLRCGLVIPGALRSARARPLAWAGIQRRGVAPRAHCKVCAFRSSISLCKNTTSQMYSQLMLLNQIQHSGGTLKLFPPQNTRGVLRYFTTVSPAVRQKLCLDSTWCCLLFLTAPHRLKQVGNQHPLVLIFTVCLKEEMGKPKKKSESVQMC